MGLWAIFAVFAVAGGLEVTCDNVGLLRIDSAPFAHGQKKEVSLADFQGSRVVVSRPFVIDTPFSESDFQYYFHSERMLLERFMSDDVGRACVPRFLGGCWQSVNETVLVVELLRGFMDAAIDASVTWLQRLRIAMGAIDALELLAHFPTVNGSHTHALYGDLFAKQFGIDRDFVVKFVDVQSFVPFATSAFGENRSCVTDTECMESFWSRGPESQRVLRGMRRLDTDDFGCDTALGLCRGLDQRTMLMAVCHLLIEPMFRLADADTPVHVARGVDAVIDRCVTRERAERASAADVRAAFAALLPSAVAVPPLEIKNADAATYQADKARFEDVRRAGAERHAFATKKKPKR